MTPKEVPFISPPAAQNGKPVPASNWRYFSNYEQATQQLERFQNSARQIPGITSFNFSIVDGVVSEEDGYVLETPVPEPPTPGSITSWHIEGIAVVGGVSYVVNEWVGAIIYRGTYPSGTDFKPTGWGGPTLYFQLLPYGPTGLAEAFLNQ